MRNLVPTLIGAMLASFAIVFRRTAGLCGPKSRQCLRDEKSRMYAQSGPKEVGIHRIQRSNWINDCIAGG